MALNPAIKARRRAMRERDRREALVRDALNGRTTLFEHNWDRAIAHYIDTGEVSESLPYSVSQAIDATMLGASTFAGAQMVRDGKPLDWVRAWEQSQA